MENKDQPINESSQPPPPFSCTFSPALPELLMQLNCTLAISTYQAGKVVFIGAKDAERLVQLPRTFNTAMGIGIQGNKLAVAAKNEVIILANAPGLAGSYPRQPNTYDGLYMPRATYYTGQVDIHDLNWGNEGLWAVNTSFSCLSLINDDYSFVPKWTPPFISKLASEDRCHLNGLAMQDGEPLYVSSLGETDTFQGWRENIIKGGAVMHIPSSEIVLRGAPMPHSPRIYDGKFYMLLSATGELVCVDTDKGKYDVVNNLSGFVRGMAKHGDYVFIGLSRLRKNSSTFKHLSIADKALHAGIKVIHLPTGGIVGELTYKATVDEIYDVQVIPGLKRPGIMNTYNEEHRKGLSTPDATYWAVEQQKKAKQ